MAAFRDGKSLRLFPVTLPTYVKFETRLLRVPVPRIELTPCSIRGTDAASAFDRVARELHEFQLNRAFADFVDRDSRRFGIGSRGHR